MCMESSGTIVGKLCKGRNRENQTNRLRSLERNFMCVFYIFTCVFFLFCRFIKLGKDSRHA